ncbi:MAG: T9SS type A sorting domain-containing protein [Saprospiraceae bacterium]|nr:T9SS type A sorting domain-containing protein [Saprospiraceae bacterium]
MTVNTPASVAGNYDAQLARFGPCLRDVRDTISGELILVTSGNGTTLACDTVTNDLTGKIAVLDRGSCDFTIKVLNAQEKGAIAVLVVNNQEGIITMSGTSTLITIPSFNIRQVDGTAIKAQIASGVSVTLTINEIFSDAGEVIVWGNNPGEGDFDGGFNGWTAINSSCGNGADVQTWNWNAAATVRGSCGSASMLSLTSCNGAAIFESDFLATGNTTTCGTGTGTCPANQFGELLSPIIDLSSSNADGFVLKFNQLTRQFQSNYFVAWTIDGGANWDTAQVNQDIESNAPTATNNTVRVPLIGTGGAANLQLKFIYDANFYYWAIDDVRIAELEANNLRVNDFFAVPANAVTPLAHIEPIGFLADIENIGAAAQSNVNLNMSITNNMGDTVFTDDLAYGNVPGGALVQNVPFANTFTSTAPGGYTGAYAITADAPDFNTSNNRQEFSFAVSDNLFSKDLSGPTGSVLPSPASWDANEFHSWAWGVGYYVPNSAGNYVQSVSFGIQPANAGSTGKDMLIFLYKWTDANANDQAEPNERQIVGFNNYTITGTETFNNLITIPFPNPEDPPILLEDDTHYILMIEYLADNQSDVRISSNNDIDYFATVAVLGDLLNSKRYAGFLGINGELSTTTYTSFGFTGNLYSLLPVARMTVGSTPTNAKDLQKLENKFSIFPNPTKDALNVQFQLDQPVINATLRIFDVSGKMLQQWQYDNLHQEQMQYDVHHLKSGTYFIQIITSEGIGTKKFIISH